MKYERTEIFGRRLLRGQILRDVELDRMVFASCNTEQGPADGIRPLIERVSATRTTLKRSNMLGAVLRDVMIDGLKSDSSSAFWNGNEFERVTFRGRVGTLILQQAVSWEPARAGYLKQLQEVDAGSEWSIDISQAEGDIDIRGYAASRIRLNPDFQKVVTRERLLDGRWRSVDLSGSYFSVIIDMMVQQQWNDTVLSANPSSKQFRTELAALQRLANEGIID